MRRYRRPHSIQRLWALATAGLVLLALANLEPILTFDVAGNTQTNRVVTGVFGLVQQGFWPVAGLVFFGAIAGPGLHLAACWYVAGACCLRTPLPGLRVIARLIEPLESWNLVPVYAVAVMVAVVKLDLLGRVEWQQGALWIVLLSLCSLVAAQTHDRVVMKERLDAILR